MLWLSKWVWVDFVVGGNKNRVSANSLRTEYFADPPIFTLRTRFYPKPASEPHFDSAQPDFSGTFSELDPKGGGYPPRGSPKVPKTGLSNVVCGSVLRYGVPKKKVEAGWQIIKRVIMINLIDEVGVSVFFILSLKE